MPCISGRALQEPSPRGIAMDIDPIASLGQEEMKSE
jgi:hypothetical protein